MIKLIINVGKDISRKSNNEYYYGEVKLCADNGRELSFRDFKYLKELGTYEVEFDADSVDLTQPYLNIDVYSVPYQYISACKIFIKNNK